MNEFWINDENDLTELRLCIVSEGHEVINLEDDDDGNNVIQFGSYLVHLPKKYELDITDKESNESNKYDPLIFGKNQTEDITNITVDDNKVYIYKKDGTHEVRDYKKWAIGSAYTEGSRKFGGHQYYKYFKELSENQYTELRSQWNPRVWMSRTPEEGFMLKNGYTYFKGMKVSDVTLYSLDIEATTLDRYSEDARVVLMSRSYRNRAGQISNKMFDIFEYETMDEFYHDIHQDMQKCNPDILLGHNILGYDLPYLEEDSPSGLFWGRNGDDIKFDEKKSKFRKDGSQSYEFNNVRINGRDVIDTMFLSIKYDIGRDFPSYGLKKIEQHLNLVDDNRIDWDFQKWPVKKIVAERKRETEEGFRIWDLFRNYCADDTISPIKMFDIMIPSFFYLTQSVPKTLQQVINEASGSQLDSLMIRSYLQDGHSIPRTTKTHPFEGAVSMGVPGVYKNVLKFDVASLYPSIMLEYNIYDKKKDPERHMLKMLEYFRDQRLENKRLTKETGDRYYDDLQSSQKIMINSMYGFMGANFLCYNFPDGAEEVTLRGREINLKGIEWGTGYTLKKDIKKITNKGKENEEIKYHWILDEKVSEGKGYELVNTDTDSFSMSNGEEHSREDFNKLIVDLNGEFSDMIDWEDDSQFTKFLVIAAKNYVMIKHKDWCKPNELNESGQPKTKYKGSSITDQKKEPILIKFLHELLEVLLSDD